MDKIYLEGDVASPELSRGDRYISLLFRLRTYRGSTHISSFDMDDLAFSVDDDIIEGSQLF